MPKTVLKFRELYSGPAGFYRVVYADESVGEGWATKHGALRDAERKHKDNPIGIIRTRESAGDFEMSDDVWSEWSKAA
jgi:hypothetical protein